MATDLGDAGPVVVSSRRRARVVALQTLFEVDAVRHGADEALAQWADEARLSPETRAFAEHLVRGVLEHRERIDRTIRQAAPNWPLEQMALVDKNVLRLAIYEIMFDNSGVPLKAAINEAVELAKRFGSDTSGRFVNGVLGTVSSH